MYEGKLPNNEEPGASLQSVSWADLSSRLSAARDLRKALAQDAGGEGSFDAASARWIADHAAVNDGSASGEKPGVNHDDLGNLKAVDAMTGRERVLPMAPERMGDRTGDRGKA